MANYDSYIRASSAKHGVPADLLWGQLMQESSMGENMGHSITGVGPAQINVAAHPEVTVGQANDPSFAIDWEGQFMQNLFNKYHDWVQALVAYNAGHYSPGMSTSYAQKIINFAKQSPYANSPGSYTSGHPGGISGNGGNSSALAALFAQCEAWIKAGPNAMSYVWGGGRESSWEAFVAGKAADCSSFVGQMFKHFLNISMPMQTEFMWNDNSNNVKVPSKSDLQPGDVVHFAGNGNGISTHVGIYCGNNKYYNMPDTGDPCTKTDINTDWFSKRFYLGAKRYNGVGSYADGGSEGDANVHWISDDGKISGENVQNLRYHIQKPTTSGAFMDYWDDKFPAARGSGPDQYKLRIGDVVTYIPPEMFQISTQNNVNQFPILRQRETVKTKNGSSTTQVTMNFYFNGEDQINGYEVEAPEGGYYWMDGLRALLAQFKRAPFLPVENQFLNTTYNIYALAFSSVTVQTVDGFPGLLNVSCVFYEFETAPYTLMPSFFYDGMIMWPLFRWHYQQMLQKNGKSGVYMKPVNTPLSQNISFSILDEGVLQKNKNVLHMAKTVDMVYNEFPIVGDYVVSNFLASFGNIMTPITLDLVGSPTFQYFGGLDTRFSLQIETQDQAVVTQFKILSETLERYSRMYRNRFVSGYLKVDNDLVNLMGVQYAMIEGLDVQTVPDFPGLFTITFSLISYNRDERDEEKLNGYNPFGTSSPQGATEKDLPGQTPASFSNFILQEVRAEQWFNTLELYPDLELPTYEFLNQQIGLINTWRKANGLTELPVTSIDRTHIQATYVDPDFYIIYPDVTNFYGDPTTDVLQGSGGYQYLDSIKFNPNHGTQAAKAATAGKFLDPSMSYTEFMSLRDKAVNAKVLRESWKYVDGNPENYTVDWIISGQMQGDDLIAASCYNHFIYSKRGSMLRAFPTYMLCIVDEGMWINSRKVWNNYYTYHAISSISVVQDRKNPADTAYLVLSNVYGALDYQTIPPYRVSEHGDDIFGETEDGWDAIKPNWSEEMKLLPERNKLLTEGYLQPGARIHLRMGYGSCAATMPIVFNGIITELNAEDEMTVVCQGDGLELMNDEIDASGDELNSWWFEGDKGQALVQYFMTIRESEWIFGAFEDVAAQMGKLSAYGIEHFGYIRQRWDSTWNDAFFGDMTNTLTGWATRYKTPSWYQDAEDAKSLMTGVWTAVAGWRASPWDPNNPSWTQYITAGNGDPYDIVKNIYSTRGSNADNDWTGYKSPDGQDSIEDTLNIFLSGKAPWDVFRVVQKLHADYVVYPRYHNLHSTLFFGMPQWVCKQEWVINTDPAKATINDVYDLILPFSQVHYIDAMQDIVHNGIKAVGTDLITVCGSIYYAGSKGSPETGPLVYADQRIKKELQHQRIVDSTIAQSYIWNHLLPQGLFDKIAWTEGWTQTIIESGLNSITQLGEQLTNTIGGWFGYPKIFSDQEVQTGPFPDAYYDHFTRGQRQAIAFSISTIAESFRDMYQGSLLMLADTSIRPYDMVFITDDYTQMHGIVEVQRTVHNMSYDTGFTTEMTPDLCTVQVLGDTYYSGAPILSGKEQLVFNVTKYGGMAAIYAMRAFTSWMTLKSINNTINLIKGVQSTKLAGRASGLASDILDFGKFALTGPIKSAASILKIIPGVEDMGKWMLSAKNVLPDGIKGILGIEGDVLGAESSVAEFDWPVEIVTIIVMAIFDGMMEALGDWLNRDHNCIKIMPLFYKGHPYVAGINGHKHLVPGYEDEFVYGDSQVSGEGDPLNPSGSATSLTDGSDDTKVVSQNSGQ